MEFNPEGDRYPDDLVNEVYTRECRYLERLSRYSWAPQNIHLLKPFRQICFEWYGNTCEDLGLLVERAFTDYIKWPEDALKEIYNKVYR